MTEGPGGRVRLQELFDRIVGLPVVQRPEALERACADDVALRREVERLLAAHERFGNLFETELAAPTSNTAPRSERAARLPPGTRVGPYLITALAGAGGMGEVYRARDTRLDREVAIKVLPDSFTGDADRVARFRREAQMLAALNHSNIAAIYDVADVDGTTALVLELVDGPTLAARIARGGLPVNEAIAIAKQIAEALEAAHEHGIIHRDLKPANIKVRADGTVKVLDFGLAKPALRPLSDGAPRATLTATDPGLVAGTAAYMAPEQARGKGVDTRADIWAFGCVLYEMLTARQTFGGETTADTLAAVVEREPDWTALPATTPPAVVRVLRRCLQKDPRLRLRAIGDARLELEEVDPGSAALLPSHGRFRNVFTGRANMLWGSMVALLAVALVVVLVRGRESTAARQPLRTAVPAPDSADTAFTQGIALSPDGQWLAFTAARNGRESLWLRRLDEAEARPVNGADGASLPFWSADGAAIGFFADRKLKLIARSGGLPRTLCDAPFGRGAAWGSSGVIVFAPRGGPLHRVSSEGGECTPATALDPARRENWHVAPYFLPDGRHFLFTARGDGPWTIRVGSLESKDAPVVLTGATRAEYAAGYLLFERESVLFAQRFDPRTLSLRGEPAGIEAIASPRARSIFSASTERLVFHPSRSSQSSQLMWMDRTERVLGIVPGGVGFWTFRLSPDGGRIAGNNGPGALSIGEIDRGTTVVFTRSAPRGTPDLNPVWSPDGNRVIFQRASVNDGIYEKTVGRQEEPALVKVGDVSWPTDWSKDGAFVLFTRRTASSSDIWVYSLGEKKLSSIVTTAGNDDSGSFSPDGRWIAYVSDETGAPEVQVRPFPAMGAARRVSTAGGVAPKWRPDGRELFYVAPDDALMAVAVDDLNGDLRFGNPTVLFRRPLVDDAPYDVTGTGADVRFLVNLKLSRTHPLELIVGWPRLLPPRAP